MNNTVDSITGWSDRFHLPTSPRGWLRISVLVLLTIGMLWAAVTLVEDTLIYASGRILPGVTTLGVSLGGLDVNTAAIQIGMAKSGRQVTLMDGSRTWQLSESRLGIVVDANATASAAQRYGRGAGSLLSAFFTSVTMQPIVTINRTTLEQGLQSFETQIDIPPTNATIRVANGAIKPIAAKPGLKLSVESTIQQFLESGDFDTIHLITTEVQPDITSPDALIQQARALLASSLTMTAYDPLSNEKMVWSVPPDQWASWLTTTNNGTQTNFSILHDPFASYLQSRTFSNGRFLNADEGVKAMQAALAGNSTSATVRVYHPATTYQVVSGDTLAGIAMRQGIPNWQIEQLNPGLNPDQLEVGQVLNIPSKDVMLPLPVVPNKRIVVSISNQHMTVYENNAVKWDWVASTGRDDSPTMPGIYQIKEHDQTAHSTYLKMDMPDFLSIYDAQPGYTNGIHGFPIQDNKVIWQSDLGHVITYGCVLLTSENAQLLYNWAEDGVVVEIQP